MASGKNHDFLNFLTLPIFLYGVPHEYFLDFAVGYVISTIFLSPDIDLKHSHPTKRWKILKYFWRPYQKILKHRGLSHTPFVGTITRYIYVLFIISIVYVLSFYAFKSLIHKTLISSKHLTAYIEHIPKKDIIWFVIGGVLADIVHIFWDIVFSAFKKIKKLF